MRVVLPAMFLAVPRGDPPLGAAQALASRQPPGTPVELHLGHFLHMLRAVAPPVGWDAAPDALPLPCPLAMDARLVPMAAAVTTEALPGGGQVLQADRARDARLGVVDPAARQARGVLELDQAAAASRAGPGMGDGRERRGSEG